MEQEPHFLNPTQTVQWMNNNNIWYDPRRKLFWLGYLQRNRWASYRRFYLKLLKLNMGPEYAAAGVYWGIVYRSKRIKCDKQLTVKVESDIV